MNEYIGNSLVKYTAGDPSLAEDQQRKTDGEKDSGLKLIPRCWKIEGRCDGFFVGRARLDGTRVGSNLVETQNNSAGAMACDREHFSERKLRRVVGAA